MRIDWCTQRGEVVQDYSFSMFDHLSSKNPETVSLESFIEMVSGGEHQTQVAKVRSGSAAKNTLPCFTVSGTFQGGHHIENRIQHSGLICMDFDLQDNPVLDGAPDLIDQLGQDEFVRCAFITASGKGLATIVLIDSARHADAWRGLAGYFRANYGLNADPSGKNENRLRFTSWDSNLVENEKARTFRRYSMAEHLPEPVQQSDHADALDILMTNERAAEIRDALCWVSPDDRDVWLRMGMAIHARYPSFAGYQIWREWSDLHDTGNKFDEQDLSRVWKSFGKGNSKIEIESLFHLAQNAGWRMPQAIVTREVAEQDGLISFDGKTFFGMEREPKDPVIDFLFEKMDKMTLIAPSKSYKSWMLQQMAMCIATGTDFLGLEVPVARKVLLIQFEVKQKWQQERYSAFIRGSGLNKPELMENFHIVNARGQRVTNMRKAIINKADQIQADVVIIDPLYSIIDGSENDAEVMNDLMMFFDTIMEEVGCALVYSHHDAKGKPGDRDTRDRGSGSNTGVRAVDTVMTLTHHAEVENAIVVDILNRNYKSPDAFTAVFENCVLERTSHPPIAETTSSARRKKAGDRDHVEDRHQVEKLLMDTGPIFGVRHFIDQIQNHFDVSNGTAKNIKAKLASDGAIVVGEPISGQRRKAFVFLPSQKQKAHEMEIEMKLSS